MHQCVDFAGSSFLAIWFVAPWAVFCEAADTYSFGNMLVLVGGPVLSLGSDCAGFAVMLVCFWFPPGATACAWDACVAAWLFILIVWVGGPRPGNAVSLAFVFVCC